MLKSKFAWCAVFLLLLVSPVLGQKLTLRKGSDAAKNVIIAAPVLHEGSFQLQEVPDLFASWTTVTNFNAFPGTNTFSFLYTEKQRFYRLVRLNEPVAITAHPAGTTNLVNEEVRLEAAATGSWPLRYQWFRNGQAVPGATSNRLVFSGRTDLSGNYHLRVSNLWSSALTSTAVVKTINPVATNIADRKIRYVIKGAQGSYINSGTFDTTYYGQGHYTTVSTSQNLNDAGNWQYGALTTPGAGRILLQSFFIYPNGAIVDLTFTNTTGGTFNLQEVNRGGRQFGEFVFVQ